MSGLLRALAVSLALTLVIELGFALCCRKRGRALIITALVNILTNPVVVLTVRLCSAPVWLMEALAVVIEGFFYRRSLAFPRPYLFSLCANALSFGLGLWLNTLL